MAINPNKKKKVKKLPTTTKIGQYDSAIRNYSDVMPSQPKIKSYKKGGLIQYD